MLFFVALPVALAVFGFIDIVVQQVTSHFVDLQAHVRRLLLVTLAWTALGWFLEARAGAHAAEIATSRMDATESDLEALEAFVSELVYP
jgi:hypothetical protein